MQDNLLCDPIMVRKSFSHVLHKMLAAGVLAVLASTGEEFPPSPFYTPCSCHLRRRFMAHFLRECRTCMQTATWELFRLHGWISYLPWWGPTHSTHPDLASFCLRSSCCLQMPENQIKNASAAQETCRLTGYSQPTSTAVLFLFRSGAEGLTHPE